MILSPVGFASLLLLPLVLGIGMLRILGIGRRTDPLAWLGWSWVLGTLGSGWILFFWLWTGPDLGSTLVPCLLILLAALVLLLLGHVLVPALPGRRRPREVPPWEGAFFGLVFGLCVLWTLIRILHGTLSPVVIGDGAEFWALKSKIIFQSGGFGADFGATISDPRSVYHRDYPLLNPLLQLWAFLQAGRITHVANRIPIQLFALAQLLILSSALSRVLRPSLAALLLILLVEPPQALIGSQESMGDLMVGLGAVMALDAWLRWRDGGRQAWYGLGCFSLAFMVWSKNEGFLYLASLSLAFLVPALLRPGSLPSLLEPRRRKIWLLVPSAMLLIHWGFNAWFDLPSAFSKHEGGSLIQLFFKQFDPNSSLVLGFFGKHILLSAEHSNFLLPCFLLLLLLHPWTLGKKGLLTPALALLLAYFGIIAILIGAPADAGWLLETSAERVSFQLLPATLLWIAVAAGALLPFSRKGPGMGGRRAPPSFPKLQESRFRAEWEESGASQVMGPG